MIHQPMLSSETKAQLIKTIRYNLQHDHGLSEQQALWALPNERRKVWIASPVLKALSASIGAYGLSKQLSKSLTLKGADSFLDWEIIMVGNQLMSVIESQQGLERYKVAQTILKNIPTPDEEAAMEQLRIANELLRRDDRDY